MFMTKSIEMEKLTAKKIVVAGATGGIGRQLVKMLHQSGAEVFVTGRNQSKFCLLYTSPSPRDRQKSRMPSSA